MKFPSFAHFQGTYLKIPIIILLTFFLWNNSVPMKNIYAILFCSLIKWKQMFSEVKRNYITGVLKVLRSLIFISVWRQFLIVFTFKLNIVKLPRRRKNFPKETKTLQCLINQACKQLISFRLHASMKMRFWEPDNADLFILTVTNSGSLFHGSLAPSLKHRTGIAPALWC